MPADTASLGLSLQWTSLSISTNIWHILDLPPNSPADLAGLLPYSDYILGTPEGVLHGESGLSELVEDHIGRPLRLYVYNSEYDVTRELTIHPSRDWGGEGALGCILGYGALHRLPAPLSEPVAGPGETLFEGNETARFSNEEPRISPSFAPPPEGPGGSEFLIPADIITAAPPSNTTFSPGTPAHGTKKKGRAHHKANINMDDYFNEAEKKSRESDYASSGKSAPPPPPPKTGGPPMGGPPTSGPPTGDLPKEAEIPSTPPTPTEQPSSRKDVG